MVNPLAVDSSNSESVLAKTERVIPLAITATGEGIANAAADAWNHKTRTLAEIGLSAGVGGLISLVQAKATLPKLAVRLGMLALGASSLKTIAQQGSAGFYALADAWNSPANLQKDRADIAS